MVCGACRGAVVSYGTFLWPSKSTSVLPVPSPRRFNEEIPAFPELNDPEDVDAVVLYVIEGNVIANSATLAGTSASNSSWPRIEIGVGES